MKGEFRGDKDSHHPQPPLFSDHHHPHHHHQPPYPPPLTTLYQNPHNQKESTTTTTTTTTNTDGATVEILRRPRGRPPGSKNKPKPKSPATVISQEPNSTMSPYILEISAGQDIITAVTRFSDHRDTGLFILSAFGAVTNVSFRQPTTTVTFHGSFEILSISATVLPPSSPLLLSLSSNAVKRFAVSLVGPQGQTIGGAVTGKLIATGTVYIVAASFNNPLYHKLPMEEEVREESPAPTPVSMTTDSVAMYSCQPPPSDVIWAPIPRQAPPHSQLY